MSAELLERATRALRASTERTDGGADARLERALERLQRAERAPARSPLRLRTAAWTLAATLAGAGAWAHATGKLPWFESAPEPDAPAVPAAREARTVRRAPVAEVVPETAAEPTLPGSESVAPEAVSPEAIAPEAIAPEAIAPEAIAPEAIAPEAIVLAPVAPEAVLEPVVPPRPQARPRVAASAPPPQHADELYREAHAAHFTQRDYGAALAAWDRYLAVAGPAHRMTVEARFNRGVALFRLGQAEAARRALRPFAEGEYGSYRREEAARLLQALRSTP